MKKKMEKAFKVNLGYKVTKWAKNNYKCKNVEHKREGKAQHKDNGVTGGGGSGGGRVPPRDFPSGNFKSFIRKNVARKEGKKWKMQKKLRKNGTGKEENEVKCEKKMKKGKEEKEEK